MRWKTSRGRSCSFSISFNDDTRGAQQATKGVLTWTSFADRFVQTSPYSADGMLTSTPEWSMIDSHLRKLLWVYYTCPWHAGVKGNDRADRLAGKATLTSGLLLGRSEVFRSLRHYPRAQSRGHHIVDRLEERGVEIGSARRSSLKGWERVIVGQTNIGTVSKGNVGETSWETGWRAYGLFRAHRHPLELKWIELN